FPELGIGGPESLIADDQRIATPERVDRTAQVLADRLAEQRRHAFAVRVGQCGSDLVLSVHGPMVSDEQREADARVPTDRLVGASQSDPFASTFFCSVFSTQVQSLLAPKSPTREQLSA